jgi:uncharacterized protein YecA (UPF0149 family)
MGAIADAIADYAQPLFDQTDGSLEEMNRAMSIAQMCWNFSLLPEDRRDAAIDEMKPALKMTDEEFAEFRQHLILPMIRRHCEMFPGLHARSKPAANQAGIAPGPMKKHSGSTRNARCSCGSGRKYKQCCGARK